MSTYPPPPRFDRKAERRAAALQAKALREHGRAQRELVRQQTRHLRRHSIVGPVLVVAIGVVALLVSTGKWTALSFIAWYSRWWPALLVVAGLIMLAEWALDHYAAQTAVAGATPGRRRLGGGIVTLLVLLVFFGMTSRTVHDQNDLLRNTFSLNRDNLFEVFEDKHSLPSQVLDEPLPANLPAGAMLTIENPHGDIVVAGKSPDGSLHVTVNKEVYGSGATGESRGDQLTPVFAVNGATLSLNVPSVEGGSADLQVLVPETLALTLETNRGAVTVTGMRSTVMATTNHGDVELRSIAGNVSAHLNHSDSSFRGHDLGGSVTLRGDLGDVSLTDVAGETNLEGQIFGDTHFERLKAPVAVQTRRTHFTMGRLDGTVDFDHSDISGSGLVGPVNLRVKSRNVSFDRTSGDLNIENSNGSVDVTGAQPGNISIDNTNGAVNLSLPDHVGLSITADTRGDSVENEFGLPVTKSNDHSIVTGTVGDGKNHIAVHTTHAEIRLTKFTPEAAKQAER